MRKKRTQFAIGSFLSLLSNGLIFVAVLIVQVGCSKQEASTAPAAPIVEVAPVEQKDVPLYGEWIAVLDGFVNAQIRPQISGYLLKQNYQEGTIVTKGDVLFEIDPRPFEAMLQKAKGDLAQAQAQLAKTTLDVERDTPLAAQSAIPQAQLDNDIQAKAAAEALVISAAAQVAQAELNLEFTKVRSLITGVAGLAEGQIGDLVGPTTVLTTVSQVDPIKAYIALGEQEYLKAAGKINAVASGKAQQNAERRLVLILADGNTYPQRGWFVLADRQIDVKTGTIRVAGAFENPKGLLRPGQFGRIRVQIGMNDDALLVPQRAITETQGTYQVVTIGPDNKAAIQPVKVGERVGQKWIVMEGLHAGDRVIVEGAQRVREGMVVDPRATSLEAESH